MLREIVPRRPLLHPVDCVLCGAEPSRLALESLLVPNEKRFLGRIK